jgi:putative nucleotidyltransferase with HDIG domain
MNNRENMLAQVKAFPAAPLTLARLMTILDDPRAGSTELIDAIEIDPGLTANVLRTCNSPFYAGNRQLSTLEEAVHRVGTRTVVQLVTMRAAAPLLGGEQAGYGMAPGDLWHHAVSAALASRLLAQRVGHPKPSLLFTGGLLHDIGKIALDVFLNKRYVEVRTKVEQGATFQEAEREVLGMEHAELGALIAEKWAFPTPLVNMIRYHHQPEAAEADSDVCSLVHLADALAQWLGVGLGRPGLASRFESSAVRRFGLTPEDLDRILIELVEKMQQTEQSLAA